MATENADAVQHQYIDIGANLTDPMFRGVYYDKQKHEDDFDAILERARNRGVKKMLVTGSNIEESRLAVQLAEQHKKLLYATVGVHPCHTMDIETSGDPDKYFAELEALARKGKEDGTVKAFGEIGMDYARLHYAPADVQRKHFTRQLDIAEKLDLPLFLHMRDCADDFNAILYPRLSTLPRRGVVHSFTGTHEEMTSFVAHGFSIGINGCSLKTEENLAVAREVPLERIMLETDAPWCEIRPSHASSKLLIQAGKHEQALKSGFDKVKKEKFVKGKMVSGRCEPCAISQVAAVVAELKGISVEELCEVAWANSVKMFGFEESVEYNNS
ncbi:putative hydrolase [Myxozyma melibiosi]|uniref:Hydrolase n=1 Tax=Myxozyma melibiosi TaxID=54550 RepID=A0ABR1F2C2_9ASCO